MPLLTGTLSLFLSLSLSLLLSYFLLLQGSREGYQKDISIQRCIAILKKKRKEMCAVHLLDIYYNYLWLH